MSGERPRIHTNLLVQIAVVHLHSVQQQQSVVQLFSLLVVSRE